MSNFWNLSDNTQAEAKTSFKAGGFDPIPAGTTVTAMIDEVKWDAYEGDEYINAKWIVVDGEHKGRRLFQKIRVKDSDKTKSDKALRMLAAIDTNSGGQLMKIASEPTDNDLSACLENKPMKLKLAVYDINDDGVTVGNWVMAVDALNSPTANVNLNEDVGF